MAEAALERVRGVVFDMDGTLTVPTMDWSEVKVRLGIPKGSDILLYVKSLPSGSDKQCEALRVIREEEERAVRDMELRDNCASTLAELRARDVEIALLTRNCDAGVTPVLRAIHAQPSEALPAGIFSQVLTREFRPAKPSPDPLLHICKQWSLSPSQVVMVGDSRDDLACGKSAGAGTILIRTEYNTTYVDSADHAIMRLEEILVVLNDRFK